MVDFAASGFGNFANGTLTSGVYVIDAGSTIQLPNNGYITTLSADLSLNGAGSMLQSLVTSDNFQQPIDNTLGTIATNGALRILGARQYTAANPISDSGILQLGGGTFSAGGLTVAGSGSIFGFGAVASTVANGGTVTATGGTLHLLGGVTGTGHLQIVTGASMEIGNTGATNGQTAVFQGTGATLKLDAPAAFLGTLSGFSVGDTLDVVGEVLTAATLGASTLVLTSASNSQTITASGSTTSRIKLVSDGGTGTDVIGYRLASASVTPSGTIVFGNHHVHDVVNQPLTVTNTAASDGYSEKIDASLASSGGATGSGTVVGLAPGASNSMTLLLGLNTAGAGRISGQGVVAFYSDGTGVDGLGATALASQTVNVKGAVYNYATVALASTMLNFGVVHVGQMVSDALSLTNGGAAGLYTEALDASFGSSSANVTASGGVSGLVAGGMDASHLVIGLNTSASGVQSGSAIMNLLSDGTGIDGLGITALPAQTVSVTGTVDTYAAAAFEDPSGPAITGSGTNVTLDLGSVAQGSASPSVTLGVKNTATGLSDLLGGTISTVGGAGFTNTGFGGFSGLGAGQDEHGQVVALSTSATGTFSETVLLASSGSNASGYNGALASETLTITGTIVPSTPTYTLALGPNTIISAPGTDIFVATAGALNSRDNLTGSTSGTNVLQLSGGGLFDVNSLATFANIQTIATAEGQAASKTAPATNQVVLLKDGETETVTVAAGKPATGNANPETIAIYAGTGTDTINLATGSDRLVLGSGTAAVTLGSAKNSVTAGGGTATVSSTTANAGAAIVGTTTGQTTLNISTAGTVTLNAADTNLTVNIAAGSKLALGGMGFITANGGAGSDTITGRGAQQTLIGGAKDTLTGYTGGGDTFFGASAALNGDTIGNWTTGDVIDLTDMNVAKRHPLGYAGSKLTVTDGTNSAAMTMKGLSGVTLAATNFTVLGSDGHNGTLIGWHS